MTLYGHEPVSRKKEKNCSEGNVTEVKEKNCSEGNVTEVNEKNCSKGNVTTAVKGKRLQKKEKKKEKDE